MTTLSNTDRKSVVLSPSLCPSSLLRVTLIKRARQPKIAAPDSTMATIFFTVSVILLICSLKTRVYGETGKWFLCQHDRIRGFSLLGILRRWIAASLIKSLEISETAISRRVCGGSISSIRKNQVLLAKKMSGSPPMQKDQVKDKAIFLRIPSVEKHIWTLSIKPGPQVAKTEMIRKLKLHVDTWWEMFRPVFSS